MEAENRGRARAASRLALLLAMTCATPALADFGPALAAYREGRFDEARREFLELAALGDADSQMNLAAMSRRGEGTPVDAGAAVGWVLAAVENGSTRMSREAAQKLYDELPPDEQRAAGAVIERYGRAALERTTLPRFTGDCTWPGMPRPVKLGRGEYPRSMRAAGVSGFAIVEFTVDATGRARDPEVVAAVPDETARASLQVLLASRYEPALVDGQPAAERARGRWIWRLEGHDRRWSPKKIEELRSAAAVGAPGAQFVLGVIASADEIAGVSREQARGLILRAAQGGHEAAQVEIARLLLAPRGPCADAERAVPWLAAAAADGDPVGAVLLAERLLARSADADAVAEARRLVAVAARGNNEYAQRRALAWLVGATSPVLADAALAAVTADRLRASELNLEPETLALRADAYAAAGRWRDAAETQARAYTVARRLRLDAEDFLAKRDRYRQAAQEAADAQR